MDERRELRGKEARARLEELERRIQETSERIRAVQREATESYLSAPERALRAAVRAQEATINLEAAGWNLIRSLRSSADVHDRAAGYFESVAASRPQGATGLLQAAAQHRRQAAADRDRAQAAEAELVRFKTPPPRTDS